MNPTDELILGLQSGCHCHRICDCLLGRAAARLDESRRERDELVHDNARLATSLSVEVTESETLRASLAAANARKLITRVKDKE